MKTKKEIMDFLEKKYNPDKTTIELSDIWDFFGITDEDLLKHTQEGIHKRRKIGVSRTGRKQ